MRPRCYALPVLAATVLLTLSFPVAAQNASPVATGAGSAHVCLLPFEATVRTGPDTETVWRGVLGLRVETDGAIDRAALLPLTDAGAGARIPVVGQASGRAVALYFDLGGGAALYGVGVAARPMAECAGVDPATGTIAEQFPLGGPFVGPRPGDTGDWSSPAGAVLGVAIGLSLDLSGGNQAGALKDIGSLFQDMGGSVGSSSGG